MLGKSFQKNKLIHQKNFSKSGFTLIEMLVSIALFSIVVTIAMGSIFTIIDANRKSQTLTLVMNNLNFALEIMTRDIKTADPKTLKIKNNQLELTNQEGKEIKYSFDPNNKTISKKIGTSDPYSIISDEVVIEKFYFQVLGESSGGEQPRAVLIVNGYAQITERIRSDFSIQTTVSPRALNLITN